MKKNIIVLLITLCVMILIGSSYASADPKTPKKFKADINCERGNVIENIKCLNEKLKAAVMNEDYVYRTVLYHKVAEDQKEVFVMLHDEELFNLRNKITFFSSRHMDDGSYGEMAILRFKIYLYTKLAKELEHMTNNMEDPAVILTP